MAMNMGTAMRPTSRQNSQRRGGKEIGSVSRRKLTIPGRKTIAYIVGVALFGALVALFTASNIALVYSADMALRLNPANAAARADRAEALVYATGATTRIADAARESARALSGDPTLARAYRMIALNASKQNAPVRPAIEAATYLTKRDYIANLWVIEQAVKDNRLDAAMDSIDASLRTSVKSQALLFPIMVDAVAEPEMRIRFVRIFSRRPDWIDGFLGYYLTTQAPVAPLSRIVADLGKETTPATQAAVPVLIGVMVKQKAFDDARIFEGRIAGRPAAEQARLVRHSNFERAGANPPFDWQLFREPAYASDIVSDGKLHRLDVISETQTARPVARQLIRLTPGSYQLRAVGKVTEGNDDAALTWTVQCAEAGRASPIAEQKFNRQLRGAAVNFTIPSGPCRNYWLTLTAMAGYGSEPLLANFASVDILRRTAVQGGGAS